MEKIPVPTFFYHANTKSRQTRLYIKEISASRDTIYPYNEIKNSAKKSRFEAYYYGFTHHRSERFCTAYKREDASGFFVHAEFADFLQFSKR